jgi:hypothetical protein
MAARTQLKVYGWGGYRPESKNSHHQTREIVAAQSKAEVARIVGVTSPARLWNLSRTWNGREILIALEEPGVVFWKDLDDYSAEPHYRRAKAQP